MFFRFLLLSNLFAFISNLTIRNHSFQSKNTIDYFLLSNKNIQNDSINNEQMRLNGHDILFISILIFLFILLLICLYYQHPLVNFILNLFSKTKNNHVGITEHVTILHQTPPLKPITSMYLTVPQPSYFHH